MYNNRIDNSSSRSDSDINGINYDIIERLYFELVRYINCEFDSIYETHKLMKEYEYGYEFSMEYYTKSSENYDKWIDNLLTNVLGFKIGHKIDQQEYSQLKTELQKHDINRMSVDKKLETNHITWSGADVTQLIEKTEAIDSLLTFKYTNDQGIGISACELIKNMTIKLDFQWTYTSYC